MERTTATCPLTPRRNHGEFWGEPEGRVPKNGGTHASAPKPGAKSRNGTSTPRRKRKRSPVRREGGRSEVKGESSKRPRARAIFPRAKPALPPDGADGPTSPSHRAGRTGERHLSRQTGRTAERNPSRRTGRTAQQNPGIRSTSGVVFAAYVFHRLGYYGWEQGEGARRG